MAEEVAKESVPNEASIERLVRVMETAYHRPWYMMWRSFLQGLMAAIGAAVGTALFFTILIWVFQALGGIELLRPGIEKFQQFIIPTKYIQQIEQQQQPDSTNR